MHQSGLTFWMNGASKTVSYCSKVIVWEMRDNLLSPKKIGFLTKRWTFIFDLHHNFKVKVLSFVQSTENIINITLFTFRPNHVLLLTFSLVRCWFMAIDFLRGNGGRRLKWCWHNIRRGGYLMMDLITKGVRTWEEVIT